ncbi:MAG: hypothetical protein ACRC1J_02220 [Sandaracinobacteroides sp.]
MTVTIFGFLVVLVGGGLLVKGTKLHMLLFVLYCSLMGGSAALILTALGGSSVSPANFALIFLVLRCLAPAPGRTIALKQAFAANFWLVLFVGYGVAAAFLLPRLFEGQLQVAPLRPIPGRLLVTQPLAFSTQNITVAFYTTGTLLAAVCGYIAVRGAGAATTIARTAARIGAIHAILGILSVILAGTPLTAAFEFFRNGSYAQLSQTSSGFVRMSGIWPEPAIFAAYGYAWLVFLTELWLRGVERRYTAPAALVLFAAFVMSTSSTAYIGLGAYAMILGFRQLAFGGIPAGKLLTLLGVLGLGVAGVLALAILQPALVDRVFFVLEGSTVNKLETESGMQRTLWAKQGIDAFIASYGIGIGPGSFRSSSLLTAILGATGIIGTFGFLAHLVRVFKPLARSTWLATSTPEAAVGAAASWTAVVMLIPVSFSAPSSDPGLLWGIFCGAALALRSLPFAAGNPPRHERVMNMTHGSATAHPYFVSSKTSEP